MAQVIPLHNHHYFKTLMQAMEKNNTNMLIDGCKDLWHINDMQINMMQYQTAVNQGT